MEWFVEITALDFTGVPSAGRTYTTEPTRYPI
jgi:hypothetical protein